jgi:hypothetical protein
VHTNTPTPIFSLAQPSAWEDKQQVKNEGDIDGTSSRNVPCTSTSHTKVIAAGSPPHSRPTASLLPTLLPACCHCLALPAMLHSTSLHPDLPGPRPSAALCTKRREIPMPARPARPPPPALCVRERERWCDVPVPVDVLLAFGSAVVWYSIASAFRCFVRGCTSVLGFGFGCSCSSLLAQPHSSTLCSLLCVVPVPLHAPRAAHTHLTHRTRRSLTTQYPHTSYTTHHAYHTNTSHHPSLTLAQTQVWDGILFVVYLGCTPVLDQVQQIYPELYILPK